MTEIIIKDKKRTLTCTMRALIAYQRVTGLNPLDIEHHTQDQAVMFDVTMGWCMLSKADQDELPLEELMDSIDSVEKQAEFSKAVGDEIARYYHVEPGDGDATDRNENANDNDNDNDNEGEKYEKKD